MVQLSLDRNIQFMHGAHQVAAGDHMIVKDPRTGHEDDVVVLMEQGVLRVKRFVTHLEIPSIPVGRSSMRSSSSRSSVSFAELPADEEKRLLAIYKMFPNL